MTKTDFSTHPWDDIEVTPLVCGLCGVDATGVPRDQVPPCITRVVNTGTHRYDVYIGRGKGSIWGNPFVEGKDGTRDEVIAKYEVWIQTQPKLLAQLLSLRGRVLGCWCKPKACHGDVLAKLADTIVIHRDIKPDIIHRDVKPSNSPPAPEPEPVQDEDLDYTTIILDVETTGTDQSKDEVVELAIQFGFDTDGIPAPNRVWKFKPTIPIPAVASKIHGIFDVHVAKSPEFRIHVQRIAEILEQAEVIIGYNVSFDINMLAAEFQRCGYPLPDLSKKAIVDTLRLWHRYEPRTLAAAHERFVGGSFEGAHAAANDIAATARVALGMLDAFGVMEQQLSWMEIADIIEPDRKTWLGPSDHFKWVNGVVVCNFGKHKGAVVHEMLNGIAGYFRWIQSRDFPQHVKAVALQAMKMKGGDVFLIWASKTYPPPPVAEATP